MAGEAIKSLNHSQISCAWSKTIFNVLSLMLEYFIPPKSKLMELLILKS